MVFSAGIFSARKDTMFVYSRRTASWGDVFRHSDAKTAYFDTGMHYIGSMDEGQVLNNFFRYFGLTDRLKLKRMDEDGYDIVKYNDREYKFAMGHDKVHGNHAGVFPEGTRCTDKIYCQA